jgi:hypothetical protein
LNWRKLLCIIVFVLLAAGPVVLAAPGCGLSNPLDERVDNIEQKEDIEAARVVEYDLVVVGSDPEGIAAAISGARNNLDTLLVDTRPGVGGLMTRGWLNSIDMNYGPGNKILNEGIFLEFYRRVGGDSFDVDYAQKVFNEMIDKESKLTRLLSVKKIEPLVEENGEAKKLLGVRVTTGAGEKVDVRARAVIDATQDADLAAAAGVPYSFGHEEIGLPGDLMAATLVFRLKGVTNLDWAVMQNYLNYRDNNPLSGCNLWSAWGFAEITRNYQPASLRIGLRGLNIGRQLDKSVLINALHIFEVNPLDPESRQRARMEAIAELPRLVQFLKENVPGLKNAELAGYAPELYIRESRHIKAEYCLTIDDVLENRDFYDRVAFGSYPVDIQPTRPGQPGVVVGNPRQYAVPFRSLVPLRVDNLLVVGRSAGYDCLAHGSARTIPVGMAEGQAAGAAAALAIKERKTFRQMARSPGDMQRLQELLNRQGMKLAPFNISNPITQHPDYEGLKFIRRLGRAVGGYYNHYGLDDEMPDSRFIYCLSAAVKQTGARVKAHPYLSTEANSLTINDVAYMFCRYLGREMGKQEAFDYLSSLGFWDEKLLERVRRNNNVIKVGVGYTLIGHFIEWVEDYDSAVRDGAGQDTAAAMSN